MPAPLSKDLRKRIIEARERGETVIQIAKEKNVCVSTINKLMALYRATGSIEPRPLNSGRKPRLTPEQLNAVKNKILEQPNISLKGLIKELNLPLCESALCRIINNKLGMKHEKGNQKGRTAG